MLGTSFRWKLLATGLVAAAVFGALVQGVGWVQASRQGAGATLNLVAYSTPQDAYNAIIPAFQKTKAGKGVSIQGSYGPSGDQSRKVAQGLPADLVAFSLAPDITRLVTANLVKPSWNQNKYHGMVTDSIVVFGVRKGNPKHIKTWNDLLKSHVDVITPNPFTSGGARWNVMAAYGAMRALGKSNSQAIAYLTNLFVNHVSVEDDSARAELQTFVGGKGDVMLAYENEVIAGQQKGEKIDYVVPPQTIRIENPVAVTTTTKDPAQAKAFRNFLWSATAQRLFGQKGYRPVRQHVRARFHFKQPKKLFTIGSLGGWTKVQKQFFDPSTGIMATIQHKKGQ
jgi:sulfate/thiosulfate transport system substrate-binding protein